MPINKPPWGRHAKKPAPHPTSPTLVPHPPTPPSPGWGEAGQGVRRAHAQQQDWESHHGDRGAPARAHWKGAVCVKAAAVNGTRDHPQGVSCACAPTCPEAPARASSLLCQVLLGLADHSPVPARLLALSPSTPLCLPSLCLPATAGQADHLCAAVPHSNGAKVPGGGGVRTRRSALAPSSSTPLFCAAVRLHCA